MKTFLIAFLLLAASNTFGQTQMELNASAHKEYQKKDAELNKVYKKLISLLGNGKEKELLVKAQRAWVVYCDAHCAFVESSFEGGSMQSMVWSGCLQQVTEERIKQLKASIEERGSR